MVQETIEPQRVLLSTVKRNVLVAKLCLVCLVIIGLHACLDASQGLFESVAMDFALAAVIAFAYLLTRWKYYRAAKIFVLSTLNVVLLFLISVLPSDTGIFLFYFPLIVASSALFETSEKSLRYFFNGLPIAFFLFLVVVDFDLLPGVQFESPVNLKAFFAVNAICTAAIMIICVNFMQKLNVSSERELKQLAEEVHGKNIHLEKTNAELDRFLYSTSHDLRSPLSSIKGLINIARMETRDEKLLRYFSMMIDRVDKLDYFIKDIIDYSKNARTDVQRELVDFNGLVAEVTDNLKYLEGAESIRVQANVLIDHPVKGDKNRLSVVLNNLMANAIKYHDPGKEDQWININVSNSNGTVKVKVSDNGMGIDPEHHNKIFDMFYRGTFQSKGSGLGLYIVKETVAKMSGTITVESKPGEGSSFFITFPVS